MIITNLSALRAAFGYHEHGISYPCGFILKIEEDRRSLLFDLGAGKAVWITFDEPLPADDNDFMRFCLESGYFNLYKTDKVPSITRVIIDDVFRDLFLKEEKVLRGTIVDIADDKKSFDVKTDLLGGDPFDRVTMQTYTPLSLPRGSIVEIDLTTEIITDVSTQERNRAVKSEVLPERSERPLATGTLACVGKPLTEHLPKDAIHLATFTAIARDDLRPGQHVGLRNGEVSSTYTPKIGITDPFCTHSTPASNLVMVMLYPNVISEVRHTWDHPKIDKELGE